MGVPALLFLVCSLHLWGRARHCCRQVSASQARTSDAASVLPIGAGSLAPVGMWFLAPSESLFVLAGALPLGVRAGCDGGGRFGSAGKPTGTETRVAGPSYP